MCATIKARDNGTYKPLLRNLIKYIGIVLNGVTCETSKLHLHIHAHVQVSRYIFNDRSCVCIVGMSDMKVHCVYHPVAIVAII